MPRRMVRIIGIVQGVGFRPFVYDLARQFNLGGWVRNQGGTVIAEVEGDAFALDGFVAELSRQPPPLARVQEVNWVPLVERGQSGFVIEPSEPSDESVLIPPDIALCDACRAELVDPVDRRFQYALLNCKNCGPRLTIVTAAPYDRERTTMAAFEMCPQCRRDFEDPADRRFHAQPIACPTCGPRLALLDARGTTLIVDDVIQHAAAALAGNQIGAIKGLGGYHLACNARSDLAVARLRERKHRDAKAFAVMVKDVAEARRIAEISPQEEALLTSPARPIVLLRKRFGCSMEGIAPRNASVGVMLPYTPLHYLLLQATGDNPLVMTSGNMSDEPIVHDDQEAVRRLTGMVDFFLVHNRPIHVRCDDSVSRVVAASPLPLRRSRGYAPAPISLPKPCTRPILAVGGQLKSTFALGRDKLAILSQHLGDLDHYEAYRAYAEAVAHYEQLFAIAPELIVHDLHPNYVTTRYAHDRKTPAQRLTVQHHHAHLASCLAEHGLDELVIGVIFDGAGLGADGAIWGGEFLIGDYRGYQRAAHFRYVLMAGGEQAIREPWRMAAAHVLDAAVDWSILGKFNIPARKVHTVRRMLDRRFNTQSTSSVGRLFDAVAALAGLQTEVQFEGQAAMELEWLATDIPPDHGYTFGLVDAEEGASEQESIVIDTRSMIAAVASDVHSGVPVARIARRFHSSLVEVIAQTCIRLRDQTGVEATVLSGGVFQNSLLLSEAVLRLVGEGFRVYRHELVPPNDGGLCLGQLAIGAAWQIRDNSEERPT